LTIANEQMKKRLLLSLITFLLTSLGLAWLWLRRNTLRPRPVEPADFHNDPTAPLLSTGQTLKVMTYNVQYMAGTKQFFFYEGGTAVRPDPAAIPRTLEQVIRIIRAEDPDILLLQEVNKGDVRTGFDDQLALLREELPAYRSWAQAFYWRASFVPHPKIWGPVGMTLAVLSKYQLRTAVRYALPSLPQPWLRRHFLLKRAMLEVRLPVADDDKNRRDLVVINTHLDVFEADGEAAKRQITAVQEHLVRLTDEGLPWLMGGDFNLLPPGQRAFLPEKSQRFFSPYTELRPLFNHWHTAVPPMHGATTAQHQSYCSLLPNDPAYTEPVCTLDHIFSAPTLPQHNSYVRQQDTWHVSDHLPLITHLTLR
jgi:endonuclease/exonuclease/phosphatase family metal-dependent hydrolase